MDLENYEVEVDGEKETFYKSSGNVFADAGLPDAEELLAKAKVVYEIDRIRKARKLSIRKLAILLGTDHVGLSYLFRGKFRGFSLDRLLTYLNKLGKDVEIRIQDKPAAENREAELFVTAV